MSSRGGFLEGLIVGSILGVLTILVAAPNSRRELQYKLNKFKDDNEDVIEATKENTEDIIARTKESIESGFDKLGDLLKENKRVRADDVFTPPKKES
jgi:gas vesicle protein